MIYHAFLITERYKRLFQNWGELATLAELSCEYKNSDVALYAVNVGDTEEVVKAYAQKSKLDLKWAFDTERAGTEQFGVQNFPTLLVIGKDGNIKHIYPDLSLMNKIGIKNDIEVLRK